MPASTDYNGAQGCPLEAKCGTGYEDTDTDGWYDERQYYGTALLIPNVTIPQGATIVSATWTVYLSDAWAKMDPTWRGIFHLAAADDVSAVPDTNAEANALSLTTGVAWTRTSVPSTPTVAPDLSTPFQEVVDRAGWASGNDMLAVWKDNGSDLDPPDSDELDLIQNYARLCWPGYVTLTIIYIV